MPQRQTAHVPSHVPVGQPLYIFDVGTHKFDGTLYRSRAHTHTHHPSLRFYGHLKPMILPLSSLGSPPLYVCYIQDSISHTLHMLNFLINPPPQKNSQEPTHYISLGLYLSHTTPCRWCTYTRSTHASCPATPARVHGGAHFFTKWQPTC